MATIKDIAKALGVSPATVSRALNDFPEVRAETKARVRAAAESVGYKPNQIAQKLVSGRSGMVGMILNLGPAQTSASGFYEIMAGLSEQLASQDIDLVFHAATSSDSVAPYRRFLGKSTLDGFILNAPQLDDPRIAYLEENGVPFVVHGSTPGATYAYFDIDNKKVASDAAHLLADLGHKRIALLGGPEDHSYSRSRVLGFRETLAARDLPVPDYAICYGDGGDSYGYAAALALLTGREGPRPTAIICANVNIAVGVYRVARDIGLSIPDDLSVIAHDDEIPQFSTDSFQPPLTVTRSPFKDACVPLARILCELLAGAYPKDLQVTHPAELIVRSSTRVLQEEERVTW